MKIKPRVTDYNTMQNSFCWEVDEKNLDYVENSYYDRYLQNNEVYAAEYEPIRQDLPPIFYPVLSSTPSGVPYTGVMVRRKSPTKFMFYYDFDARRIVHADNLPSKITEKLAWIYADNPTNIFLKQPDHSHDRYSTYDGHNLANHVVNHFLRFETIGQRLTDNYAFVLLDDDEFSFFGKPRHSLQHLIFSQLRNIE